MERFLGHANQRIWGHFLLLLLMQETSVLRGWPFKRGQMADRTKQERVTFNLKYASNLWLHWRWEALYCILLFAQHSPVRCLPASDWPAFLLTQRSYRHHLIWLWMKNKYISLSLHKNSWVLFFFFSFVFSDGTLNASSSINESLDPQFKNTGTKYRQALNQLSLHEEKCLLLIFSHS